MQIEKLNTEKISKEIIDGNRIVLAQAITLIESNSLKHYKKAQKLLDSIFPFCGNSIRIGITGTPGVGKSTFIESFGNYLCEKGHKVAVLAIDPSSSKTGGSILGDKTRMESLSNNKNAVIRPSPSSGTLGGVASKTRETLLLCEAAGFDIIIVETIGVGQSEISVRSLVDFMALLILPEGGDELQGLKKGSVELSDVLIINKADGDNIQKANLTKQQYSQALHYMQTSTNAWTPKTILTSALINSGIEEFWEIVLEFINLIKTNGNFIKQRTEQYIDWFHSMLEFEFKRKFYNSSKIKKMMDKNEKSIKKMNISPRTAVEEILKNIKF